MQGLGFDYPVQHKEYQITLTQHCCKEELP